jgi:hypothetical protein
MIPRLAVGGHEPFFASLSVPLEIAREEFRAMDRRRYRPAAEAIEDRTLQTTFPLSNLFGTSLNTNLNVPITFQQKSLRIEHLPFYLEKISPGRFLPKAELQQIQSALFGIMDGIHKPPPSALNNYNYQLRNIVPHQSISPADIERLDYSFGAVLKAAKTPAPSIDALKAPTTYLASVIDTASVMPVVLATNDYTLILETALAIGRPMPPPSLPRMKRNNGIQANAQHMKTPLHRPHLVGTYHFHTTMEVVNSSYQVIGSAPVRRNSNYNVQITTPLPVGVYKVQLVAVDTFGHNSRPSRPFLIKVVPNRRLEHELKLGQSTPKGPAATAK